MITPREAFNLLYDAERAVESLNRLAECTADKIAEGNIELAELYSLSMEALVAAEKGLEILKTFEEQE